MRLPFAAASLLALLLMASPASAAPVGDQERSFMVASAQPADYEFVVEQPGYVTLVVTVDAGTAADLRIDVVGACVGKAQILPTTTELRFNCGYLYLRSYEVHMEARGVVLGSLLWDFTAA
jgi:hypothetical protein